MLEQGTKLQDRYVIRRQLGQGGMGAVYEATDGRFGTPVALKEIVFSTPDEQQREYMAAAFEREAKALATIQHECIPFVRDYFSEENREYLVMELVAGDDLGCLLEKQKKPFPIYEALGWLRELLDALDYLHNLTPAIIHRDIKPQNLKVTLRKRLKLLDFGIAKSGDRSAVTTRKQTFIGATLDYSPFEQILRVIDASFREFIILKHADKAQAVLTQETDERSDIFSAGAAFYHLLTNRVPEDATKRTLAVWEGQPDPLPHPSDVNDQISRPVGDMLMDALSIDRDERYATAAQMLEALNQAVLGRSLPKPKPRVGVIEVKEVAEVIQPAVAKTVEFPDLPQESSSFHAAETHAFTISKEKAIGETEEFAPPATDVKQSRVATAFLPVSAEPTGGQKQSTVETVSLPSSAELIAAPKQSNIRTEALPDSKELLSNLSPAHKPKSNPRWLAAAVGFVLVLVTFAAATAAWLGGFIGGGTSPSVNKPAAANVVVSQTPIPSPSAEGAAATPAPTAAGPSGTSSATTKAADLKTKQTAATKSPPPAAAPVQKPKQKPKAGQDLNCVYTNSC